MNRANQVALFQQTNQGLLDIRQAEINYYMNINVSFGTQAALICGFMYSVFTQQPRNEEDDYSLYLENFAWVSSAITVALGIHVVLNTVILQVVGPGLALYGPIGSIVRATEGMKIEQKHIITSFIYMMLSFACSTILSFWVVMDFESAMGGTVVFIIAARYWYYYTERIYLRFYWDANKKAWDDETSSMGDASFGHNLGHPDQEEEGDSPRVRYNSTDQERNKDLGAGDSSKNKSKKEAKKSKFAKFMSKITGNNSNAALDTNKSNKNSKGKRANSTDNGSGAAASGGPSPSKNKTITMEGYLSKSGITMAIGNTLSTPKKEPWERRYFTLGRNGAIFYYLNRVEFRNNPKEAINKRPLKLSDYIVFVDNSDQASRLNASDEAGSAINGGDEHVSSYNYVSDKALAVKNSNSIRGSVVGSSYNFFTGGSTAGDSVQTSSSGVKNPLLPKHHFQMTLVLKEEEVGSLTSRKWLLRTDTEEELEEWIAIMREVSPSSFLV